MMDTQNLWLLDIPAYLATLADSFLSLCLLALVENPETLIYKNLH
jgi:hypothetical protein